MNQFLKQGVHRIKLLQVKPQGQAYDAEGENYVAGYEMGYQEGARSMLAFWADCAVLSVQETVDIANGYITWHPETWARR